MTLDELITLTEVAMAHRHSPWEIETCDDPSDKQYVRMGCDFIVEPPTHSLDTGENRMRYIAACDPATLLPLLRDLKSLRSALETCARPDECESAGHCNRGESG